ncbi:four helix bundle protein [Mesotoga sp. B105.6.4]|uniref:four helix bundle protein n=1 Tax=Mesotoga sp. B105.6.4 TaxID=1582224 RepID=UPI000CCC4621|nr:four helix bundle protein [Mesotoga sp. B105.6.4]PNS40804.1 30S ribosomal protein S23 [Mesotoga sp. B105.6.4]
MLYKDLDVYRKSIDFVVDIYKITESFPDSDRFGLVSQLRRAAVSLPSNLAEGSGRNGKKELINFLHIARGSLFEIGTQLEISQRLGFVSQDDYDKLEERRATIQRMMNALISSLRKKGENHD